MDLGCKSGLWPSARGNMDLGRTPELWLSAGRSMDLGLWPSAGREMWSSVGILQLSLDSSVGVVSSAINRLLRAISLASPGGGGGGA